jgi:Uma2 family endonuclease
MQTMSTAALKIEDLPHYTYDDYVQWEGRWELIHGIPYAMVPAPVIKHQLIAGNIYSQLKESLKSCKKCKVLLPVDWPIAGDTVVQPDLLVVCGEDIGEKKLEATPIAVFEVLSPATSKKDRVIKYRLYEEAGVKYYCIVDPDTNSVTIFVLQKDKYWNSGNFKEGQMPMDLGPCQIEFDIRGIFDQY